MSCSICYEAFKNKTNIGCGHSFCKECIDQWAQRNNTCPLCREVFCDAPEDDIEDTLDNFLQVLRNYIFNEQFKQQLHEDFMSNQPHRNTIPLCNLFWSALNRQQMISMLIHSGVSINRIGFVRNSLRTLIEQGPGTQNNPIVV